MEPIEIVIQPFLKSDRQNVIKKHMKNNRNNKTALLILINVLLSCTINQKAINKTKQGSYKINIKTNALQQAIIYGTIYDYEDKTPLHFPKVQLNDKKLYSGDINGKYRIPVSAGKYRITGKALPYQFVTTKTIIIKQGDSVELNIYLKPYDKPLYNK